MHFSQLESMPCEESNPPNAPNVSQRYIDRDNTIENAFEISKDSIYKKLSKRINGTIEFVECSTKNKDKLKAVEAATEGVRLFNDTDIIKHIDYFGDELIGQGVAKKPKIKRRIIEPDELREVDKLKLSVIEGEQILQQMETKAWKPKKIRAKKVFNYREKKSVFYLQEPENEFTARRRKNNWTECKIANFHKNRKNN